MNAKPRTHRTHHLGTFLGLLAILGGVVFAIVTLAVGASSHLHGAWVVLPGALAAALFALAHQVMRVDDTPHERRAEVAS